MEIVEKVQKGKFEERGKMNVSEIYEVTNEEISCIDIVHRRNSERQDWTRPPRWCFKIKLSDRLRI